ncbi:DoxX family protein [Paenibacillus oleatilyticus]|uniref:DoxX family protein n=1 Tax=Paenibacillus oleatilyticus TaxID=2594886 RepID=UPI001C1FB6EF|nr:DoxX family protein [Paenibacillus oleatilyticus]MBU7318306.1 DoxX family protein [Paenibacillus oleatilyticus]
MNKKYEVGLLLIRLVLGISFLAHGVVKFQSGIGNIAGWFESIGLPGFAAYVVGIIEVAGGIALILGLGTRIVSTLFALLMAGAIVKAKWAGGFLGSPQMAGYELDLAFFVMALALAIAGSSLLSLDSLLFAGKSKRAAA